MNILSGYKTYIVCAVAIAYAIVQWWTGALDLNAMVQMILAALGGIGLRLGVSNTPPAQ